MKRIPNKAAVCTVCYYMTGFQKVKVYDFDTDYDTMHDINGRLVFDGKNSDLIHDWQNSRYAEAECRGIRIEDNTVIIKVFTKYEEYK